MENEPRGLVPERVGTDGSLHDGASSDAAFTQHPLSSYNGSSRLELYQDLRRTIIEDLESLKDPENLDRPLPCEPLGKDKDLNNQQPTPDVVHITKTSSFGVANDPFSVEHHESYALLLCLHATVEVILCFEGVLKMDTNILDSAEYSRLIKLKFRNALRNLLELLRDSLKIQVSCFTRFHMINWGFQAKVQAMINHIDYFLLTLDTIPYCQTELAWEMLFRNESYRKWIVFLREDAMRWQANEMERVIRREGGGFGSLDGSRDLVLTEKKMMNKILKLVHSESA